MSSTEDLKREFRPRFFALAKKRLECARGLSTPATASSCDAVAREMHALAGEAGLLGIESLLGAARHVELAAGDLAKRPDDTSTRDRFEHALGELEQVLMEEGRTPGSGAASSPRADSPRPADVRDKFRARFVEAATARRQAMLRAIENGEAGLPIVLREFHTLGGEASMLAMAAIAALCREGEDAARRLDVGAVRKALEQLEIAIFSEDPAGEHS